MNKNLLRGASVLVAALMSTSAAVAQEKPTMGWSSWNTFALNISEEIIVGQAAAMRTQGFYKVGYNHINIDDGFQGGRDPETGQLLINPKRFPNGLLPVVRSIHRLGLKAGIYSDGGHNTCGNYHGGDVTGAGVGMYEHDQQDADFYFKELGFDFIKVDFCGGVDYHNSEKLNLNEQERYTAIANAIKNTGRTDVRLNVCRWDYPGNWVHDVAASWRTTGDINASWGSVKSILAQNLYLSAYAYDGHFNDMDMLEVGKGMSIEEDKTHFGMWCIMSSPLLIGCNLKTISGAPFLLLKNTDLIALNQDDLCIQAYVAQHEGDTYVLVKDLETLYGKTRAVALYNPSDKDVEMSVKFTELDLDGAVKVRDLYEQKDLDEMTEGITVSVPRHGTRIYRLDAETRLERNLYEAETAYLGKYQEIYNNQAYVSAIYKDNDLCSGREVVGWLGGDINNDLQWRHVYSDQGGEYEMTLKFISGESRNMTVELNGKEVSTLSYSSGGWSNVGEKKIKLNLEQGENVIRLYNKNGDSMPDMDCMTIHPVSTTGRVTVGIDAPKAQNLARLNDGKYYELSGRLVKHPARGKIYVYNGKKVRM